MQDLNVTVIQTPLFWEDKDKNLAMFRSKISAIDHTDLVVLPEMFNSGFTMNATKVAEKMNGETVSWMKEMSVLKKSSIVGSIVIEENGGHYNRMIYVRLDGSITTYDKRFLFSLANEDEHYTAGEQNVIVDEKGWKIMLQICYDLRFNYTFQNHLIKNKQPLFDVLINVANWPEKRADHWSTLLKARAIENQCYVIGVNRVGEDEKGLAYSGDTSVFNALGESVLVCKPNLETTEKVTLDKTNLVANRQKLNFLKDVNIVSS